ncbi:NAD(P)H-dependent oxidoreductase [Mangrovivirga sp. M17]|uniref:NAD(P)H-dependent oxidoreductase n=1 Tax=Mangrovivirga halotolerans TaxID=2993936 RepID=A0ABT3RMP6_9BACT|nr:NADPH-dependent FMN reductase [Mangrovivirga halotolerans]MCX2742644.1 NAD(P)H-dependent oxidoreductase [Mangrovivirga halotolerans]
MDNNKEIYTIISGTNRKDAVSPKLAAYYQTCLSEKGIEAPVISLDDLPDDFVFSALYENAGKHEVFNKFRERMLNTTKFIFIVPEYNGSFPGVLKAFIDGMQYPDTFSNKKCALVGLSSGVQGAGLALSHLTDIFNYCGTHVLAHKPKLSFIHKHFDGEEVLNDLYKQLIDEQVEAFLKF